MNNREIAKTFQFLAKIMELHDESPFKTRSYANAYINLRKVPEELINLSHDQLMALPGVGKAIADKILELGATGELKLLNRFKEITPEGVQEMLTVKGLGPKKVNIIWKQLNIDTVGELIYACRENRLVSLKGFGQKTQKTLLAQLEYFQSSRGKSLYGHLYDELSSLEQRMLGHFPKDQIQFTGQFRRKCDILSSLSILTTTTKLSITSFLSETLEETFYRVNEGQHHLYGLPLEIIETDKETYARDLFLATGPDEFFEGKSIPSKNVDVEQDLFALMDIPVIIPELRDHNEALKIAVNTDHLINLADIRGVIHSHTTYSDGINSVEEMVKASMELGYDYLLITDHSQSAFYANGLKEDRVYDQMEEIDLIQKKYPDFDIYKGIESDILSGGGLDYEDDLLACFDVIIASVHSNLKMDEDTATRRLITAIENPYTHILGHPTGRLLLSREGYPLDMAMIIDACAANEVIIEMNANPMRLDIDWRWISYAQDKGVMISINPDAHSICGIDDIKYGVFSARKGGLLKDNCLNAKDADTFRDWVEGLKY